MRGFFRAATDRKAASPMLHGWFNSKVGGHAAWLPAWVPLLAVFGAAVFMILGVVSFFQPFSGQVSPTQRTWVQFVITEGNLRVIYANGPDTLPAQGHPKATPQNSVPPPHEGEAPVPAIDARGAPGRRTLDDVKLFWRRVLLVALPLRLRYYPRTDPSDSRYGASELRLDVSTFILAPALLLFAWMVGPGRRVFAHVPAVWREIWNPSQGGLFRPASRMIHRLFVAGLGLGAAFATMLLLLSFVGTGSGNATHVWTPKLLGERVRSISLGDGALTLDITPAAGATGRNYRLHVPGFRIDTRGTSFVTNLMPITPGLLQAAPSDPEIKALLKQIQARQTATGTSVHRVRLALWAPMVLFGLYPVVALIRGPVRRARRCSKGQCLACGYNLTGLIEPRCPECGTIFSSAGGNQPG